MTGVERRYRALVRLFPPAYRARREEELVATLLDAHGEGLRLRDVADLVRAAAVAWLRAAAGPPARPTWRTGVALGGTLLLAVQSAFALVVAANLLLLGLGAGFGGPGHPARLRAVAVAFLLTWPAAFLLLTRGRHRAAVLLPLVGTAGAAAWVFGHGLAADSFQPLRVLLALGAFAVAPSLALALAGPPARPGRALRALPWLLGAAGVAATQAALRAGDGPLRFQVATDLPEAPVLLAAALVVPLLLAGLARPHLAVAAAVLATPVAAAGVAHAVDRGVYFDEPRPDPAADLGYLFGHWDFGLPVAALLVTLLLAAYAVARASLAEPPTGEPAR